MTWKKYGTLFLLFAMTIVVKVEATIRCYACFYDENSPNMPGSDEDCIRDNFDGTEVGIIGGFKSCYISQYFDRDGDVVSVIRGGDQSSITDFGIKTSRDSEQFATTYCADDLCNSSSCSVGVFSLLFLLFIIAQIQFKMF